MKRKIKTQGGKKTAGQRLGMNKIEREGGRGRDRGMDVDV